MSDEIEFEHDDEWYGPDGWAPTPNRIARDGGEDGLSWEARGMFTYLRSHSPRWRTRMRDLEREGNCGRERTRRILGELIEAGYVIRERRQAEAGGPLEWTYRLRSRRSSRVTANPSVGDPDGRVSRQSGDPIVGKPVPIEDTNSSEHQLTEHSQLSPPPLRGEDETDGDEQPALDDMPAPSEPEPADEYAAETGFAEFWQAFPRKVDKRAALRAYRAARRRGVTIERLLLGARSYASECQGREARYVKHAATWLNADAHANEPEARPGTAGPSVARAAAPVLTDAERRWRAYPDAEPGREPPAETATFRRMADSAGMTLDEFVEQWNRKQAASRDNRWDDVESINAEFRARQAAHRERQTG